MEGAVGRRIRHGPTLASRRSAGVAWKNGTVATSLTSTRTTSGAAGANAPAVRRTGDPTRQLLRHIMVVGGTLRDWHDLGAARWDERVDRLGEVADNAGASYLTLRAFEPGPEPVELPAWERTVGTCHVVVDPCGDGRQRFAEAMHRLSRDEPVNEATIAEALYSPADGEPDLIVVLGASTRLPPSLVWELAYGELVFHPMKWDELEASDLVDAIADFAQRQRRFGGLDEES